MTPVVKLIKDTNDKELITVDEFLSYVGSGTKKREEALKALIEGRIYQDLKVAFYIESLLQ